ncbi:hypothetical protein DL96DRAFT_1714151 [Flagelloscypha sp. PMI_526]|nr:hypothetical protein DL96DRAFT_1714151 [Flagelloscypha sp. PMI_526]
MILVQVIQWRQGRLIPVFSSEEQLSFSVAVRPPPELGLRLQQRHAARTGGPSPIGHLTPLFKPSRWFFSSCFWLPALAPLPAHTWHVRQDGISITQATSSASSTGIVKLSRTSQYPVSDAVSHHFLSYSFDPAFFYELWGNTTHPNLFSFKMLKNVEDRIGGAPFIRPGGVTQDSSIYNESAGTPERTISETGGIYRTTWGPDFYKSFKNFSPSTKFVIPLNFGNDSLEIALDQAKAAAKYVNAEKILAFELGNEAGNYKATQRNLSTWNTDTYIAEWLNWTTAIDAALPNSHRKQPHWWTGSDGITEDEANTVAFQTTKLVQKGINNGSIVKEFSQHMYQYSSCKPASNEKASLVHLLNHTNITSFVDIMVNKVEAARSVGAEFVVGEFNSVSCSGKVNLTDTFAQALWVLDTTLASATVNVARVHLHMGATLVFQSPDQANIPGINGTPGFSTYNLWYPRDSPLRGERRANPSYVSQLFLAEAIGKTGQSQIQRLPTPTGLDDQKFAAYAIYENSKPARLALINMAFVNSTIPHDDPKIVQVDLQDWLQQKSHTNSVAAKRMTAPGIDTKQSDLVTWAGQAWTNGTAFGREEVEKVNNGLVKVRGSEAVLVFL